MNKTSFTTILQVLDLLSLLKIAGKIPYGYCPWPGKDDQNLIFPFKELIQLPIHKISFSYFCTKCGMCWITRKNPKCSLWTLSRKRRALFVSTSSTHPAAHSIHSSEPYYPGEGISANTAYKPHPTSPQGTANHTNTERCSVTDVGHRE